MWHNYRMKGIQMSITKTTTISDLAKHKTTYNLNGCKLTAIANFLKNTLEIKKGNRIVLTESLNNYTNANGLNMKGYVEKIYNNLKPNEVRAMNK